MCGTIEIRQNQMFDCVQGDSIKAGPILKRFYLSNFLLKSNKFGLKINIKHLLIDSKNNWNI